MSAVAPPIDQEMQQRIAMARMICVLCMIFVHVPDGDTGATLYAFAADGFGVVVEGLLVEGPGRASAALLSVISGYLAATTLMKRSASVTALYRRRFVSIVLPMVFWASVTYFVYWLVSQARPTFINDADSWLDKLNIIFFITETPIGATMHLGFLRDLFVCFLLSPILLPLIRHVAWLVLPAMLAFYLMVHSSAAVIILRPLIIFAFCIGIFLATRKLRLNAIDRYWPLFALLAVAATLAIMLENGGAFDAAVHRFAAMGMEFDETVLYPLGRLFGSLAIWTMIPMLTGGHFHSWVERRSPYLFAAFCSHYLILTLIFFGVWSPLFGGRDETAFLFWFLMAPLLAMYCAIIIVQISLRISPWLAMLITGGRMKVDASRSQVPKDIQQGPVPGFWLSALRLADSTSSAWINAMRDWFELSRRLLLGRR